MIEQPTNGNGSPVITGADMLALIVHITSVLTDMEGRIMDRLTENSAGATDRWTKHEQQHVDEYTARLKMVMDRFAKVESALDDHIAETNAIFARMHDERIASDARVQPVKTVAGFLIANWRSIALAILALLGLFGWAGLETHIMGR